MSYEDAVIRIGNKGTIIDITMYEDTPYAVYDTHA